MAFDFQNLTVYQKAKGYHQYIRKFIAESAIDRITANQLHRASLSVPLNIEEASGRFSLKDRRNFWVIARSSVFECVAIVDQIDESEQHKGKFQKDMIDASEELSKMLYTMIRNASKQIEKQN